MHTWNKFDQATIEKTHDKVFFYRKLYEGRHSEIFPRAKELIEKGEIIDNLVNGYRETQNVRTPYIVANISKLICEIPATLVSRSIGKINTSITNSELEQVSQEAENIVDNPIDQSVNESVISNQQAIIEQIERNSRLRFEHWGNVVQQQIDGGLVGVPWYDEKGLRIEFKARDVYYPHDDGLGADLAYEIEIDDKEYLHVYRERVENGNLTTSHTLYELNEQRETAELEEEEIKDLLGMSQLQKTYQGRSTPFIVYWANEKTILNPLGVSALRNQDGKQDDVNWTLTRNAITFERNGKPRIAVSKEIMRALEEKALQRYGDENKIDHRDLEITTFDDEGKAMEIIQVDISQIGDVGWVKDLIKLMLMETQTSEKAVDFYLESDSQAQSGIAKFYDLFTSLLKAERIQQEYIYFIQELIESALWLANYNDDSIIIEEPDIQTNSMIPISKKELLEENTQAFEAGTQSLETAVRRMNPNASEEWILEEIERIEAERESDDTFSLMNGRQSLTQMMGNRDANGNPITEEEE